MKVAVYIRTDAGMAEAEQKAVIQTWVNTNKGPVQEYVDDKGGFLRDGLERLMDDIQTGKVEALVVARLDRLDMVSTAESEFMDFLRTLVDNRVRFISIADHLDSADPAGTFFTKLEPAIRRAREIVRGERIRLGLQRTREEGHALGRPRAADYDEIVRLRQQGLSIQAIADNLHISRGAVQHCLKTLEYPDLGPA